MVHAYWFIGREIVEVEQHDAERAGYGEGLMKRVAARLSTKFGKGFSLASLKRMKQLYLAFPRGSALAGEEGGKGSTALGLSAAPEGAQKSSTTVSLSPGVSLLFPPTLAWSHYLDGTDGRVGTGRGAGTVVCRGGEMLVLTATGAIRDSRLANRLLACSSHRTSSCSSTSSCAAKAGRTPLSPRPWA